MQILDVLISRPDRCRRERAKLGVSYQDRKQVCLRVRLAFLLGLLGNLALPWLVRLAGGAVSVDAPGVDRHSQARRSRGSKVRQWFIGIGGVFDRHLS